MNRWSIYVMTVVMLVGFSCLPALAQTEPPATEADDAESQKADGQYKVRKPTYTYRSSDKRDPFRSLIEVQKEDDMDTRPRTPLESFNTTQMNLIAIISDEKGAYAMIGLPDKKHYFVREGMNIGLHDGVVREIRSDRVVVEEIMRDYRNNEITQEVFIKLRKEGDI